MIPLYVGKGNRSLEHSERRTIGQRRAGRHCSEYWGVHPSCVITARLGRFRQVEVA